MLSLEAYQGADQAYLIGQKPHIYTVFEAGLCLFCLFSNRNILLITYNRLAPFCSFIQGQYLTDGNLSIASLLSETGGISVVTNKRRKLVHTSICT